ncbi:TSPO(outer membrane tryptophan-rich sensory protein)-like protein [Carex rostrata]
MATSEGIKHRAVEKPLSTDADATDGTDRAASPTNNDRKVVKAKRSLPTLAAALIVPVVLSATSAYLSGTTHPGRSDQKSSTWQFPILVFHLGNIVTAALTSLSAWLFWAKGGFHRRPTDILFYLGQLMLGLAWGPAAVRLGDARLGFAVAVAMLFCLFGCSRSFHRVNPASGDLVIPCLAWAMFLVMFSYRLM